MIVINPKNPKVNKQNKITVDIQKAYLDLGGSILNIMRAYCGAVYCQVRILTVTKRP
jgi:hypothetical protein